MSCFVKLTDRDGDLKVQWIYKALREYMKTDIKMMNFDAAKNIVTGIVEVNNTTITVGKFDLQSGASTTQALQELSERAVRDYKALDVKWLDNIQNKQLDISGDTHE